MNRSHFTEVRQAPGWWPSLCQAVCSCGWHGPVRDMYDHRGRGLLRIDQREHVSPAASDDDDQDDR